MQGPSSHVELIRHSTLNLSTRKLGSSRVADCAKRLCAARQRKPAKEEALRQPFVKRQVSSSDLRQQLPSLARKAKSKMERMQHQA